MIIFKFGETYKYNTIKNRTIINFYKNIKIIIKITIYYHIRFLFKFYLNRLNFCHGQIIVMELLFIVIQFSTFQTCHRHRRLINFHSQPSLKSVWSLNACIFVNVYHSPSNTKNKDGTKLTDKETQRKGKKKEIPNTRKLIIRTSNAFEIFHASNRNV